MIAPLSLTQSDAPVKPALLPVDTRVMGKYRGKGKWFPGKITARHQDGDVTSYDIAYDDGDTDLGLTQQFVMRLTPDVEAKLAAQLKTPTSLATPSTATSADGTVADGDAATVAAAGDAQAHGKSVRFAIGTALK